MFTAAGFLEECELQRILNIDPAEGNRPLSVFRDTVNIVKSWHVLEYYLVKRGPKVTCKKLKFIIIVIFLNQN